MGSLEASSCPAAKPRDLMDHDVSPPIGGHEESLNASVTVGAIPETSDGAASANMVGEALLEMEATPKAAPSINPSSLVD